MVATDLSELSVTAHRSPYPGLRPYTEGERDLFFGRDAQIRDVLRTLEQQRVVAILGGSGCGKSSLVRAGVIPDLRAYGIAGRETWVTATFTPLNAPIVKMAEALEGCLKPRVGAPDRLEIIQDILRDGSLGVFFDEFQRDFRIGEAVSEDSVPAANLLVLVDQFEEVFRQPNLDTGQTAQLIRLITNTRDYPHDRVFLIFTMRSEFLDHCANDVKLSLLLNAAFYLTRRLDEKAELGAVILQPARRYAACYLPDRASLFGRIDANPDWPFEGPGSRKGLMDQLLAATADLSHDTDHLPLLQHMLFWLWRAASLRWGAAGADDQGRLGQVGTPISEADLRLAVAPRDSATARIDDAGNLLKVCLNNQAQLAYESLSSPQRLIAEQLFCLLAEFDRSEHIYRRRWTSPSEVLDVCAEAQGSDLEAVLLAFTEPHPYLRVVPRHAAHVFAAGSLTQHWECFSDADIDVCHESLIRNWKTFREWLDREGRVADCYDRLLEKWQKETGLDELRALASSRGDSGSARQPGPWYRIIRWLHRLWSDNTDLLNAELVGEVEALEIEQRNARWAWRYQTPILARLSDEGLVSTAEARNELGARLHTAVIGYFQASRQARNIQRRVRVFALPGLLFIAFITAVLSFNNQDLQLRETLGSLELNAFQPHAVATGLGGAAQFETTKRRPHRLWQLAFTLKALEDFEREFDTVKAEQEGAWITRQFFESSVGRLERLRRMAQGAAESAARENLSAVPWPEEDRAPPANEAFQAPVIRDKAESIARDARLRSCVIAELQRSEGRQFGKNDREPEIHRGWGGGDDSWRPIVVQFATVSYLVAEMPSGCRVIFPSVNVPGGGKPKIQHDAGLKLLSFRVAGDPDTGSDADDLDELHVFRVQWFTARTLQSGSVADHGTAGRVRDVRADVKWLGSMPIAQSQSISVADTGEWFSIKDQAAGEHVYRIPWTDRPQPVADSEFHAEVAVDASVGPSAGCAAEDRLRGEDYRVAVPPVWDAKRRYVAYVLKLVDDPNQQSIRVIEPMADDKDCASYQLPVGSLSFFSFPTIDEIRFGSEPTALFLRTDEGRHYKLTWGSKALRREICQYLPPQLRRPATGNTDGQGENPSDLLLTSPIFQLMSRSSEGPIYRASAEPPC